MPKVSRVAVLWNPGTPWHKAMLKEVDAVAPSLRLQPLAIVVRNRGDLEGVFSVITRDRVDALFVSGKLSIDARTQLLNLAAKRRLPTMFGNREYVPAGGLMSYGVTSPEMFRQAAVYVDKIIKGAKPGDLPIEQPTKFLDVINELVRTRLRAERN